MQSKQLEKVEAFNSQPVLKQMWIAMRLLGLNPPEKFSLFYTVYSIVLNSVVTFFYPFSMFINMFLLDDKKSVVANLTLTLCVIICSVKTANNFLKRHEIRRVCEHLKNLDSTIEFHEDVAYLEYIRKIALRFFYTYGLMYGMVSVTCDLPVLFAKERRLLYPAWFPWDWKNSTRVYTYLHAYQLIGINIQIYQNLLSDHYPGTLLWLLKGHLHALGMRVQRLGFDKTKTPQENYKELVQCIQNHKICMEFFQLCQNIISRVMILQFICTELTLCAVAVYVFFVGDNLYEVGYLAIYFISMVLEITLICYCGSALLDESQNFTTALYSCNWVDQDVRFRKVLIIFMQHSQKPWSLMAGGVVGVSLATWLTVLKSTYSLFAVFNQLA